MPCGICKRHVRGFGYDNGKVTIKFCSNLHLNIYYAKRLKTMVDPDNKEIEAMQYAGAMGGQYLESINKFDLRSLSLNEWQAFVGCLIGGFTEKLHEIESNDVPF